MEDHSEPRAPDATHLDRPMHAHPKGPILPPVDCVGLRDASLTRIKAELELAAAELERRLERTGQESLSLLRGVELQIVVDGDRFREEVRRLEETFGSEMSDNDWRAVFHMVLESCKSGSRLPDLLGLVRDRLSQKRGEQRRDESQHQPDDDNASGTAEMVNPSGLHRDVARMVWISGLATIGCGMANQLGAGLLAGVICVACVAVNMFVLPSANKQPSR